MAESILFLTGHLARPRLEAVLEAMQASFAWKVLDIGVKVAALMTEEIITRRLQKPIEADKIMLPGRCRADLDRLSERFGHEISPGDIVVVGDTPLDIACARAGGAWVVAVATGNFSRAELEVHQPDVLLEDLQDTEAVVKAVLGFAAAVH